MNRIAPYQRSGLLERLVMSFREAPGSRPSTTAAVADESRETAFQATAGAAPLVALGPPLTAGWLRRPAFVRKRARARTKAHRFLIPRSAGCLPKRDVARPAGSRLLGFSLEGRRPRLGRHGGRTARRTRNRLRGYSADRTMIAAWTCGSRGPATTTRGRPGSSNPGS